MNKPLLRSFALILGFYLIGLGMQQMPNPLAACSIASGAWEKRDLPMPDTTSDNSGKRAGIVIPEGTRITLQLFEDVSSRDQATGRLVQWGVYKDVRPAGGSAVVIVAGAYAEGKITSARRAGVFGRPGRIAVNVTTVEAVDGQRIPVYCKPYEEQGKDRRGLAWCLGIGLSIVGLVIFSTLSNGGGLFLIAVLPMFLGVFISGKDVTIHGKSTLIEVTVQRDITIRA